MRAGMLFLASAVLLAVPLAAADNPCAGCHDQVIEGMSQSVHLRVRPLEVQGHVTGCQGCHGDGTRHAAEADPALIRNPKEAEQWDAICLECHAKKKGAEWKASQHATQDVGCLDCHAVHQPERAAVTSCRSCHADVNASFQLVSHHPVREGHMTCSSCHDVHGAGEAQLRTKQRVNDLCYGCHQSHEGPYIFEHEPVQEDCRTCHLPHGSANNNLLTASEPTLCLQCHDSHFQAGYTAGTGPLTIGGNVRENPYGTHSFNVGFTTKCTQCHSRIHGTDLPSQSVPGGGRALTR